MSLATVVLSFDPVFRVAGWSVRWQTVGIGIAILAALVVAAWFASRSGVRTGLPRLRLDDLLYLTIGAVPGAIVGGRALHVLAYLDYYQAHPEHVLDPAQGSLSLLGAVVGGSIAAAYLARLLDAPVRRWADVASVAVLSAIGLGKLALVLGGEGQGALHDGTLSIAFLGDGPWASPAASTPAYASQVLEGAWALAGIAVVLALHAGPVLRSLPGSFRQVGAWAAERSAAGQPVAPGRLRFGYLFLAAIGWWLIGRVAVGFTWREEPVVGALNAEQAMGTALLLALVAAAVARVWPRGPRHAPVAATTTTVPRPVEGSPTDSRDPGAPEPGGSAGPDGTGTATGPTQGPSPA